jgi:hypothetical protein
MEKMLEIYQSPLPISLLILSLSLSLSLLLSLSLELSRLPFLAPKQRERENDYTIFVSKL